MIEQFADKFNNGRVRLEFAAETDNIVLVETKFDENTGVEVMKPTTETNSKHIADLKADVEERIAPYMQQLQDLTDLGEAVASKEAEREAAKKKAVKGKE